MIGTSSLNEIFHPRSVAVIGASQDERKWGYVIAKRLIDGGYTGEIYLINPKAGEILGRNAYPSITDVPGPVDTVIIGVSSKHVLTSVEECVQKKVKGIVIVTSGFGETGAAGKVLENQIVETARQGGARIIGPNCLGICCTSSKMNLTPSQRIRPGSIAFASQSGNLGAVLFTAALDKGMGFSYFVSVGNQSDIDFSEYISYFGEDPETSVIALYAEGFKNGERFLEAARKVTPKKPIVLLKGGRTSAGSKAASTHTGSLAGKIEILDAALNQVGVIRVDRMDEFFAVVSTFVVTRRFARSFAAQNVVSVTDGGGFAVLTADICAEQGLELAEINPEIQDQIAAVLPPHAPKNINPIDTAGGMDDNPGLLADCCEQVLKDERIDAILTTGIFGGYGGAFSPKMEEIEVNTAKRLVDLAYRYGKPFAMQTIYGDQATSIPALRTLVENGIPVFSSLDTAIRCLKYCNDYETAKQRLAATTTPVISKMVAKSTVSSESAIPELCKAYDLPIVPVRLADTAEKAAGVAKELGFPVVLKVDSPDISHKTDAGGVALGLMNGEEVINAYHKIISNSKSAFPDAQIMGVSVSPQIKAGTEVIVGIIRDDQFGPVVMVGLGGIMVELIKDVTFRVCPVDEREAISMLKELKTFPLLNGFRNMPKCNLEGLGKIISKTSILAAENPQILSLEFNPVIVSADEAWIVDQRAVFS